MSQVLILEIEKVIKHHNLELTLQKQGYNSTNINEKLLTFIEKITKITFLS